MSDTPGMMRTLLIGIQSPITDFVPEFSVAVPDATILHWLFRLNQLQFNAMAISPLIRSSAHKLRPQVG